MTSPLLEPTTYDFEFLSHDPTDPSGSNHHQGSQHHPMHFASPLKMTMNEHSYLNTGISSNLEDISSNTFISLDPVTEPAPYLYGLDERDTIHSLYDPTATDNW